MENTKLKLMTDAAIVETITDALANVKSGETHVDIVFENIRTKKRKSCCRRYIMLPNLYTSVYYTSTNLRSVNIRFVNCTLYDINIDVIPFCRVFRDVTYTFENCEIDHANISSCSLNNYSYNFFNCNTVRKMFFGVSNKQIATVVNAYVNEEADYNFERCEFTNVNFTYNAYYKFNSCRFSDVSVSSYFMAKSTFTDCNFVNCVNYYQACPESGSYVGYKKAFAKAKNGKTLDVIVKLEIPADAKRSSAMSRKCRASKAKVLEIKSIISKKRFTTAFSSHDNGFKYKVGETVEPTEPFDTNRWHECTSGIHHFITREEAIRY